MEFGTYILSVDKSHAVWGQTWFENYPIRYSQKGIERLSVIDKDFVCYSDCIDIEKSYDEDMDSFKKNIVKSMPFFHESSKLVSLTKLNISCGNKYSHIYRPIYTSKYAEIYGFNPLNIIPPEQYVDPIIDNYNEYNDYIHQLELLLSDLYDIFKVVEPNLNNEKVYGNAFRNIIIRACTEVDSLMKKVSEDNGLKGNKGKYNTQHYVRFKNILQIDQYTTNFNYISDLEDLTPFNGWNEKSPTESLSWYNAYNLVKHDRINKKEEATMHNAIESIMAFAIVMMAQFGYRNQIWQESIGKIIKVVKEPQWRINDFYFPVVDGEKWNYVNYPDLK